MCTALTLTTKDFYFGRTLDLDCSYGEEVAVMPRRFPLAFRHMGEKREHYAIIGMAMPAGEMPLYYDAANEHGLAMAGLNFPENAFYAPLKDGKDNVASFEFIPWILCQCKNVAEARVLLDRISICDTAFSRQLPSAPLHWMIADREEAIVVEQMKDGLHIYNNLIGVMTNNPPFPYQLFNLNNYRALSRDNGENRFGELSLEEYCQGLGGLGLPGDLSSMSRFVRIAFGRANSVCLEDERSSVSQFFHLLGSVEMTKGLCRTKEGSFDYTVYISCINAEKGVYYYTTYDNRQISCVDLRKTALDGDKIERFPLVTKGDIFKQN